MHYLPKIILHYLGKGSHLWVFLKNSWLWNYCKKKGWMPCFREFMGSIIDQIIPFNATYFYSFSVKCQHIGVYVCQFSWNFCSQFDGACSEKNISWYKKLYRSKTWNGGGKWKIGKKNFLQVAPACQETEWHRMAINPSPFLPVELLIIGN